MPLPDFREDGWLPEGHWATTWEEIEAVFGGKPGIQRQAVFLRILRWRDAVRDRGMAGRLILDGSFISQKVAPGDFDAIFVYDEQTEQIVENNEEAAQWLDYDYCKAEGYGDVLILARSAVLKYPAFCRVDGFDLHKDTNLPKGVVEVDV